MNNVIKIKHNFEIISIGQDVPERFLSAYKVGDKLRLSKVLSEREQYFEAQFLRWCLESTEEFLVLSSHHLSDQSHQFTMNFRRLEGGVAISISNQRDAEESQKSQKVFFWDNFINCFDQGVVFVQPDGTIDFVSKEAPHLFPLLDENKIVYSSDSLVGKNLFHFLSLEVSYALKNFIERAQTNRSSRVDKIFESDSRAMRLLGYPIYSGPQLSSISLLAFDITEKTMAQRQLKKAEEAIQSKSHLVALGEVAASIAHEINTPLGALSLNISMLKRNKDKMSDERFDRILDRMHCTNQLIADIVDNLLSLSRDNQAEIHAYQNVSFIEMLKEVRPLLKHQLQEHGIKLNFEVDEKFRVDIKKVQFQQVMLNMIKNSIHALSSLDESQRWVRVYVKSESDMVMIFVEDGGKGILQSVLERIDEPFFTTKKAGEGSGLGLSICQSIIKSHGGHLEYCGKENTCFRITIPKNQGYCHAV